jgi:hypothetical protein
MSLLSPVSVNLMRALRDPNLAEESILFILVLEYREIKFRSITHDSSFLFRGGTLEPRPRPDLSLDSFSTPQSYRRV